MSKNYFAIPELEGAVHSTIPVKPNAKRIKKRSALKEWGQATAFTLGLFLVGFFTINASAYSEIIQASLLNMENSDPVEIIEEEVEEPQPLLTVEREPEEQKSQLPPLNLDINPPDFRLVIPSLEKNIPVITSDPEKLIGADWKSLEKTFQEDLRNGVIHYPGTALPGQEGNIVITGHSSYYPWDPGRYKSVFARLNSVKVGESIEMYYGGEHYEYVVREIKNVKNSDVSILEQGSKKWLTIFTCTPVGTNLRRHVVIAEQVN